MNIDTILVNKEEYKELLRCKSFLESLMEAGVEESSCYNYALELYKSKKDACSS